MLSHEDTKKCESLTKQNNFDINFESAQVFIKSADATLFKNEKEAALAEYLKVLSMSKNFYEFKQEQQSKILSVIVPAIIGIASIHAENNLFEKLNEDDTDVIDIALSVALKDDEFLSKIKSESKIAFLFASIRKHIDSECDDLDRELSNEDLDLEKNGDNASSRSNNPCAFFKRKAVEVAMDTILFGKPMPKPLKATLIGVPLGMFAYSLYCAGVLTAISTLTIGASYGVLAIGAGIVLKDGYNKLRSNEPVASSAQPGVMKIP